MPKPYFQSAFDKAAASGAFGEDQLAHLRAIIKAVMDDEKYKPALPAFFTVQEYAKRLKVADDTVRDWITEGLLDAQKLNGQKIRIPRAAVEKFERARLTSAVTVSNS